MVITVRGRGWSVKSELIEMQVGKFRGDQIYVTADIVKTILRCNWKTGGVRQSRVKESAFAMHLEVCDKSIPVGHRTPACPGMQIDSCQAKRRRNQRRGRFGAVKGLSIHKEFSIEFSRPPAYEHRADSGFIHIQQLGYAAEVGRKIDDRSNIQVPVGPAILAMTDSGSQRIVNGGMAECALDAHRFQIAGMVEESGNSTTAFSFNSATVTAGSLRLTFPAFRGR